MLCSYLVSTVAQHPRYLLNPRFPIQYEDVSAGQTILLVFLDPEMVLRASGYLREMGDYQHLSRFGNLSQRL